MGTRTIAAAMAAAFGAVSLAAAAADKSVEVVHWWTSGGEAAALKVLKDDMQKKGYEWKDSPVAGGGGDQARTVLRARVAAGNPPEAMQMLGFAISDYAEEGLLGDLTPDRDQGRLGQGGAGAAAASSPSTTATGSPRRSTSTAPTGSGPTRRSSTSSKITPPKTFDELLAAADKMKKAGYIAVAHGGQPWQDATIFDSAVLSARRAGVLQARRMVELDQPALGSRPWTRPSSSMRSCAAWSTRTSAGRDWNLATAMVINGKAGMQIMGDWAKGEFITAGKKPGKDFLCFPLPGTEGASPSTPTSSRCSRSARTQETGAAGARQRDHGPGLPGDLQPGEGLDPGAHGRIGCQVRRLRQEVDGGLEGGPARTTRMLGSFAHGHAVPRGDQGRDDGRRHQVLQLRQIAGGCHQAAGGRGRSGEVTTCVSGAGCALAPDAQLTATASQ